MMRGIFAQKILLGSQLLLALCMATPLFSDSAVPPLSGTILEADQISQAGSIVADNREPLPEGMAAAENLISVDGSAAQTPIPPAGGYGKFTVDQYLAVGSVLLDMDAASHPSVKAVLVDDRAFSRFQQGMSRLVFQMQSRIDDERIEKEEWKVTKAFDKTFDKIEKNIDKLKKNKLGRKAIEIVFQDPERVSRKVCVQIMFDDGCRASYPVGILRMDSTVSLQATAMAFESLSLIPLIGRLFPFAGSVVMAVSSVPTLAATRKDLAMAMLKTSRKLLGVGLVGMVPGIHSAVGASAAAIDLRNVHDIRRSPTVTVIDNPDCTGDKPRPEGPDINESPPYEKKSTKDNNSENHPH